MLFLMLVSNLFMYQFPLNTYSNITLWTQKIENAEGHHLPPYVLDKLQNGPITFNNNMGLL